MRFLNHMLIALAPILVSSSPIKPLFTPNGNMDTPLNVNITFASCDAEQQTFLQTTMSDVHTLTVMGQCAAELITTGEAYNIQLFDKRTYLTPEIAHTLLERWLGHADMAKMPNATMDVFKSVEDILIKGHASLHFDCNADEGECDASERGKEVGYVWKVPLEEAQAGDIWWKVHEIEVCDKFWDRPTLDTVVHGKDLKGNDTLPASWVILDEFVMPIVNVTKKEALLKVFTDDSKLQDGEIDPPDATRFLRAQMDADQDNPYAFHQYNAWPGYALELTEAAYKGRGHVPASALGEEEEE